MALLFRTPKSAAAQAGTTAQIGLASDTFSNLGSNLSYSAVLGDRTPLPSWMTFDGATGAISISNASVVGSYDVLIRAQDSNGTSAPAVERVVITGALSVADPLADRSFAYGTSFSFTVPADTFTMAAGRTVRYDYNALAAIDSLTAGYAGSNYAQTFLARLRGLYGDGGSGYQASRTIRRSASDMCPLPRAASPTSPAQRPIRGWSSTVSTDRVSTSLRLPLLTSSSGIRILPGIPRGSTTCSSPMAAR